MCRVVAPLRLIAANEDLAIVTFDPLPDNVLNFNVVQNIIIDYWLVHRVVPWAILLCHLGQAYERDNLINQSPISFCNIQVSFAKHNEGHNWRKVFFNEECWMMLLGFPEDYKSKRHIHNAISDFARIILWEQIDSYPGRIMVRARVMSVEAMLQFIVYSDPANVNGNSWTI